MMSFMSPKVNSILFYSARTVEEGKDEIVLLQDQRLENKRTANTYEFHNKDWNEEKAILSHILEIKFPNLTSLTISVNKIESIESLSRIYMPLTTLWLGMYE